MLWKKTTVQKEARETRDKVFADRAGSSSEAMATYRGRNRRCKNKRHGYDPSGSRGRPPQLKLQPSLPRLQGPKRRVRRIVVA